MMRRRTLGNRLRLLVALVALVPLVIVGSLTLFWLMPETREEITQEHKEMAHSVAFQVVDHLHGAQRQLSSLATYLTPRLGMSSPSLNYLLDSQVGAGDIFTAIYIADGDDLVQAVGLPEDLAGRRSDLLGIDLSRRKFVQTARKAGGGIWSDTYLSTIIGKLAVAFAMPVNRHLIIGEVAIGRLTNYLSGLPAQSQLAIAVLDSRGQVIAHSKKEFAGQQLRLSGLGKKETAFFSGLGMQYFELAGQGKYIATVEKVKRLGWQVLVAQPLEQAMKPLSSLLWALGIGLFSALFLAMVAGWLMVRGLAGDFSKLTDQARVIGEGQYDQPWPDSSIGEFADLEASLKKMSAAIRQREEALSDSEARLLKAQSVAHVGSWELDLARQIMWGSDEAFRIYGLSITENNVMDLKRVQAIPLSQERPRLDQALENLIAKGAVYDLEYLIARVSDGELRYVHTKAETVSGPDGTPIKVMGTVQDVTEIKQAEENLEASRQLLLESQAVAQLGHYSFDVAGGTWESSAILDGILGIDNDYAKDPDSWLSLINPEDRGEMESFLQQNTGGNTRNFDREYRIIRADDQAERWVHGLGRMEVDEEGNPVKIIGTIQDISERKQLEQQLLQSQKMEAIGLLAGGVAHDFNNMLGVILGYTELLLMEFPSDAPQHKKLGAIEKAALHSRDITRQLLAFSRKQIIAPSPQNPGELINRTLKTLTRLIGEDVSLTFHPADEPWFVKVDPSQFDQILVNLAVNAREAMANGGKLLIELSNISLDVNFCRHHPESKPGNYIMLAVSDTGHGMDQETMSHIFEPFFTTKGVGKGTGLGLATIYGIVKQNGGFINVYSELGRGTTFKIYLPRHLGEDEPLESSAQVLPEPGSGTIMLVEDEDLVRQVAASMLEELGYTVVSFGTPVEAIEQCKNGKCDFDLLLTDVVMPEMSGKELQETIKNLLPQISRRLWEPRQRAPVQRPIALNLRVVFFGKEIDYGDIMPAGLSVSVRRGRCLAF
jgi:PAS domain S-box-containing protein